MPTPEKIRPQYNMDISPVLGPRLAEIPLLGFQLEPVPVSKSLVITRKMDVSSPRLFQMCVAGTAIGEILIRKGRRSMTEPIVQVRLSKATLTDCHHNSDGTDSVSVSFEEMRQEQSADVGD